MKGRYGGDSFHVDIALFIFIKKDKTNSYLQSLR